MAEKCRHFILHKSRSCRMNTLPGSEFCGQHIQDDNHVPCPLDPAHSVHVARLQKHLTICNSRRPEFLPPFFSLDVNLSNPVIQQDLTDPPRSTLVSELRFSQSFLDLIDAVYGRYVEYHPLKKDDAIDSDPITGQPASGRSRKHKVQVSALVDLMADDGLLTVASGPVAMIEFGAGRAQLSAEVAGRMGKGVESRFLLIDRQPVRHKQDPLEFPCQRIKIDIKDLRLDGVNLFPKDPLHDSDGITDVLDAVAYGKHLCGGATDLTINCLLKSRKYRLKGLTIALCCHHRCSYETYCNQNFLKLNRIGVHEFDMLCRMSSWATCDGLGGDAVRQSYGLKCKRILDIGRILCLHDAGHENVKLIRYASSFVTLENLALLVGRET